MFHGSPEAVLKRWLRAPGLLMLVLALGAAAQELVPQPEVPFLFRTWQAADGLPHNTVSALTRTPDGYLWVGTYGGLARFDGVNCKVYGLKEGLRNLQVSKLLSDKKGTLWIGTIGGGLSRLREGKIEGWMAGNGLAGDTVMALAEDLEGVIWVGTTTGLSQWRAGSFSQSGVGSLTNTYIRDIVVDRDGAVWIATLHQGLIRYRDGEFNTLQGPGSQRIPWLDSLLVDQSNRLWAGTVWGTVLCLDKDVWTSYPLGGENSKTVVQELAQTADGTVWAGTMDDGLFYLDGGQFRALRENEGLASDAVEALLVDRDQRVWVGMRAGGLCQLRPRRVQICRVEEAGVRHFPLALAETADGRFWAGTYGRGLFWWNGTNYEQLLRSLPISGHLNVEALLPGRDGSLWWGAGPVVYQWKDSRLAASVQEAWLRGDRVLALCEDTEGGMWIGTRHGQLRLWRQGSPARVAIKSGSPVICLLQEPGGTVWAGTLGGGLMRIDGGTPMAFTARDGLGSDSIQALHLDSEGTLWVGTAGGGLSRRKGGRIVTFTTAEGLADENIAQILEDERGNLWLGCDRGIMRIAKADLEDVVSGKRKSVHPVLLSRRDGMIADQCTIGFRAAIKSSKGRLLFCAGKGIVMLDPEQQAAKAPPPEVCIEEILVDGAAITAGRTDIEADHRLIEFRYTGLSFDEPERVQFRHMLKGLDTGWVEAGRTRVASYAHIPPGQYEFRVIACNSDGVWNEDGASLRFSIRPRFWQRGWFSSMVLAVCLGATAMGIRVIERRRYRRRLKRLEMEQAMENERARIARDLHDELGSSLTRISMLGGQMQSCADNPSQTRALAGKLTGFTVRTTQAFEEIVWAVNPRNDSLGSLLEYLTHCARELFEDSSILCRFQIPTDVPDVALPPDTRHSLFLVVKEALTNALKHSRATQVCLRAELDPNALRITVEDNGCGIDAAGAPPDGEHNGLRNMRQRIKDLGGRLQVDSAPGRGVTVEVTIGLSQLRNSHEPAGTPTNQNDDGSPERTAKP